MTATVHQLPGTAPPRPESTTGLNLSFDEVVAAAGGYVRAAEQLRELQARGFVRAYRRRGAGPVILERAHYDAVVRGQFGAAPAANDSAPRAPIPPNRTGFKAKFGRQKQGA